MQINPYLHFNGQCKTAFEFYAQALGGKIEAMLRYSDSPNPEQNPSGCEDKIMHALLKVGTNVLMGSDSPPQFHEPAKGFSITISVDDTADAERIFHALADNGTVRMPIQETFWALRFGVLVDRFGTPWMINCMRPH